MSTKPAQQKIHYEIFLTKGKNKYTSVVPGKITHVRIILKREKRKNTKHQEINTMSGINIQLLKVTEC